MVSIGNIGYSLVRQSLTADRSFIFTPYMTSITPTEGSIAGKTRVTITGGGFKPDATAVYIDVSIACTVEQVTHDEIICLTGSAPAQSANTDVQVRSGHHDLFI